MLHIPWRSIPTGDCGTLTGRWANNGTGGRERLACRAESDICGEVEGSKAAVWRLGPDEDPKVPVLAAALRRWWELYRLLNTWAEVAENDLGGPLGGG